MTECILNLLDPSATWGGQLLPIFIDLVPTNILLAMLGFPLSQKSHADFCFKCSVLFFLLNLVGEGGGLKKGTAVIRQ